MTNVATDFQPALLSDRFNTLRYDRETDTVLMLDRRVYPFETRYEQCDTVERVAWTIEAMVVQGGPPRAYVAGLGLALAARQCARQYVAAQRTALVEAARRLVRTRPTADDLHWLMEQALAAGLEAVEVGESAFESVVGFVEREIEEGKRVSRECGRHAATLVEEGDRILTHCFAGAALNYMLYFTKLARKEFELVTSERDAPLPSGRAAGRVPGG